MLWRLSGARAPSALILVAVAGLIQFYAVSSTKLELGPPKTERGGLLFWSSVAEALGAFLTHRVSSTGSHRITAAQLPVFHFVLLQEALLGYPVADEARAGLVLGCSQWRCPSLATLTRAAGHLRVFQQ